MPVPGLVDAMEMTVTLGASDDGFGDLSSPVPHEVEVRWAQQMVDAQGKTKMVGYKAFANAYAKTIPGVSLEVGSAGENEMTLAAPATASSRTARRSCSSTSSTASSRSWAPSTSITRSCSSESTPTLR